VYLDAMAISRGPNAFSSAKDSSQKKKKKKFEQKSIPISGSSRTLKLPNKNCLIIGLTVSRTSSRYEKTNLSRKQEVKTK
jgi:hypothetical protein